MSSLMIHFREFLDQLSDYKLLRKGCAPWKFVIMNNEKSGFQHSRTHRKIMK